MRTPLAGSARGSPSSPSRAGPEPLCPSRSGGEGEGGDLQWKWSGRCLNIPSKEPLALMTALGAEQRALPIRSLGALRTEPFSPQLLTPQRRRVRDARDAPSTALPAPEPEGKGLGSVSLPHSLRQRWCFTCPLLRGAFVTSRRSLGDSGLGEGSQGSSYNSQACGREGAQGLLPRDAIRAWQGPEFIPTSARRSREWERARQGAAVVGASPSVGQGDVERFSRQTPGSEAELLL